MSLAAKLAVRVLRSQNPKITRIYLCESEYLEVAPLENALRRRQCEYPVTIAGARVYRLSDIGAS